MIRNLLVCFASIVLSLSASTASSYVIELVYDGRGNGSLAQAGWTCTPTGGEVVLDYANRIVGAYPVACLPPNSGGATPLLTSEIAEWRKISPPLQLVDQYQSYRSAAGFMNSVAQRIDIATSVVTGSFSSIINSAAAQLSANLLQRVFGGQAGIVTTMVSSMVLILGAAAAASVGVATAQALTLAALVGGTLSITAAMLGHDADIMQQHLQDPPDPNFHEVYAMSGTSLQGDFGFGEGVNQAVMSFLTATLTLQEANTGLLTSLERYQGAIQAGDDTAATAQLDSYMAYQNMLPELNDLVLQGLFELPELLINEGIPDQSTGDVPSVYDLLREQAQLISGHELQSGVVLDPTGSPTAVPEPGTLGLLGAGLLGLGFMRRKRTTESAC